MKHLLSACLLLCSSGLMPVAFAQTNPPASDSRYLFVFDTSAAMKRRAENIQRVTGELIASGMNGQMRVGDTIGIWTFNESLKAGSLAPVSWTPARRMQIASRFTDYLRAQKKH